MQTFHVCVLNHFSPPGSSVHGIIQGKNTGVGCHALHQGIFPTQGRNPRLLHLLHWQVGSLQLVPPGKPEKCWFSQLSDIFFFPLLFSLHFSLSKQSSWERCIPGVLFSFPFIWITQLIPQLQLLPLYWYSSILHLYYQPFPLHWYFIYKLMMEISPQMAHRSCQEN